MCLGCMSSQAPELAPWEKAEEQEARQRVVYAQPARAAETLILNFLVSQETTASIQMLFKKMI